MADSHQTNKVDAPLGHPVPNSGFTTAQEIIDSWTGRGISSDPLRCTKTLLPLDEKVKLWHWANERVPRLILIIVEDAETLIVSLPDMRQREFIWNPKTRQKEIVTPRHSWQPAKPAEPEEEFDL